MAKSAKKYTTTLADMVENKPMTREAYKNLTLQLADDWVRINHPEIKAEWISICREEQEIIKLFPNKKKTVKVFDENNKPVMRTVKKRGGSTQEVQKTTEIPYQVGEKRLLNAFEICAWLCNKYGMSPEVKTTATHIRDNIGNW